MTIKAGDKLPEAAFREGLAEGRLGHDAEREEVPTVSDVGVGVI